MRIPPPRRIGVLALPLLALLVGSCSTRKDTFAPACPVPGLVAPLAQLARHRGASQDIRELIIRARIVDISGTCEPGDDPGTVVTKARVVVEATRGPAMQGDAMDLPVFLAVTDAGAILDKSLFWLPVKFVPNVDTTRGASAEIRLVVPVTPQKSAAAYGLIAGFQLTPEEIAIWRRDNPRP